MKVFRFIFFEFRILRLMALDLRQNFVSSQYLQNKFSPNFIYAFILTRSSLGSLHVIFHTFVPEFLPLIYAKISFPLNISEQIDRFSQNFIYTLTLMTRSRLELIRIIFCTIVLALWPLIYAKICFRSISLEQTDRFSLNFIYVFILTKSKLGLLHIIFRNI